MHVASPLSHARFPSPWIENHHANKPNPAYANPSLNLALALKLGADAAVIVYDPIQPVGVEVSGGWWNRTDSTITGRKLVRVAIECE